MVPNRATPETAPASVRCCPCRKTYEGEEYSVPASLAYELSGAVFDGMTLMTGVIDVQ